MALRSLGEDSRSARNPGSGTMPEGGRMINRAPSCTKRPIHFSLNPERGITSSLSVIANTAVACEMLAEQKLEQHWEEVLASATKRTRSLEIRWDLV